MKIFLHPSSLKTERSKYLFKRYFRLMLRLQVSNNFGSTGSGSATLLSWLEQMQLHCVRVYAYIWSLCSRESAWKRSVPSLNLGLVYVYCKIFFSEDLRCTVWCILYIYSQIQCRGAEINFFRLQLRLCPLFWLRLPLQPYTVLPLKTVL